MCVNLFSLFVAVSVGLVAGGRYNVGTGRADCTGPAAEVTNILANFFLPF